jgi:Domain of unknown function (DUF4440)
VGSDEGRDELIELEHRWMEAVRDRDIDFLERLLAPEFTLTTGRPGAEVRNREEWLAVTRDTYVIEEFGFDELYVDVYPGTAVVRSKYHQRGRMGDADRTQPFLMTDVFIRRDDGWVAVTRHLTPLPPAPAGSAEDR